MLTIIFIILALASGTAIAHLVFVAARNKDWVKKDVFEYTQKQLSQVQIALASRLTRDEVQLQYIPVQTHQLLKNELAEIKSKLEGREQQIADLSTAITVLRKDEQAVKEKLSLFNEELERLHKFSREEFRNGARGRIGPRGRSTQ